MPVQIDTESWKTFRLTTEWDCCWWCGRGCLDLPSGWHGPWLVERAHITNTPRLKDRRCAILLCSLCHRGQHGAKMSCIPPMHIKEEGPRYPNLEHMLGLKRLFDPDFYDRKILQHCYIGLLPRAASIPLRWRQEFRSRRGGYPSAKV